MSFGTSPTATQEDHWPPPLRSHSANDQRRHARAALTMRVRLRWLGPFGLETEITESRDMSRGGLLVLSGQARHVGSLVWVTFPYDSSAVAAEPETRARVARCETRRDGEQLVGIAFESRKLTAQSPRSNGPLGSLPASPNRKYFEIGDRRRRTRVQLSIYVTISKNSRRIKLELPAHEGAPWPEETMTMNVSPTGILFCTLRIYEVGDRLKISLPDGGMFPVAEPIARVIHIEPLDAESPLLCVGVEFVASQPHVQKN